MKQKLTELKGKIDNSTIFGDFNTLILIMGRTTRQRISKDIKDLNNIINQPDLTNICITLYQQQ